MASKADIRVLAPWIAVLGAIGVFVLDLLTPAPVAVASLYVLPMLALVWWGKKRGLYLGAVVCSGLILLSFALMPARQELPYALINRILIIAVLLLFAVMMGRRVDSRRELLRQYSRMKKLLDERNFALESLMTQQRQTELEKSQLLEQLARAEAIKSAVN